MNRRLLLIFLLLLGGYLYSDVFIQAGGTIVLDNDVHIVVEGSWNNLGTFLSPNGSVTLTGSDPANYFASGANLFDRLTIDKLPPVSLTLNSVMQVDGVLTVDNGFIVTDVYEVVLGQNGYVVGSLASILGNVSGTPVAVGTSAYNNSILGVNLNAGNNIGNLEVLLFLTPTGFRQIQTILNQWRITSDNPPSGRNLTLSWNSSEDNGIDLNNVQAWRSSDDGITWFQVGAPAATSTNPRSLTIPSITSFSNWTVGNPVFLTSEEELDFGVCDLLSMQSQQIVITNVSSSTLIGTASISPPYSVSLASDAISDPRLTSQYDESDHIKSAETDDLRNTISLPSISPDGSITLNVTYYPQTTGIHNDDLIITFGGAGNPSKAVPVSGTTIAAPGISVIPSALDFGDVYLGEFSTEQFSIENSGTATLTGDITTPSTDYTVSEASDHGAIRRKSSSNGFSEGSKKMETSGSQLSDERNTISFSIPAGSTAYFDLSFAPASAGTSSGNVVIQNNAGADELIAVSGNGVYAEISVDPAGFNQTMQRESSYSDQLEIDNLGNGALTYTAVVSYPLDSRLQSTVNPASIAYWTGTCTSAAKVENSEARGTGGSASTRETGWMKFDISAIPDSAIVYSIKFNGYVNQTNWPFWSITPCQYDPVTTDAATLAAHIFGNAGTSFAYLYRNESNTFSTGWKQYELGGNAISDFESALANGWFALGIAERDGVSNYYLEFDGWNETNAPYLEIEYTFPGSNWLTINDGLRVEGSVLGSPDLIAVDFNSAGISDGTYSASIEISSNDPDTPLVSVPVTLNVETPEINVAPLALDYGYIEVGTNDVKQFTIENYGSVTLSGEITTPVGFTVSFSADNDSGREEPAVRRPVSGENRNTLAYSVAAGNINTYNLLFEPDAVGDYSGTVVITDNAPGDDFSITLTAYGDIPNIDVTPSSFNVSLTDFETASETLTLENTSNLEISYTASVYTQAVYPESSAYWTGSTDGSTLTENSEVRAWNTEDGWMKFDISAIPDNAVITNITFHGYVNATYYPYWQITGVALDPLSATPADLKAAIINSSNQYNYFTESSTFSPGWKIAILGGNANTDLQAALSQGWFCLGIDSTDNYSLYYLVFDGWDEPNPPYLHVSYTLPEDLSPWLTIDDDTSVSGIITALDTASHTIGFDPSLVGDGTYSTNIRISSNDADEPEILIPVTMTVASPKILLDPLSIDFGAVLVDDPVVEQFTIENPGTATLSGTITTPDGYGVALSGSEVALGRDVFRRDHQPFRENRNTLSFSVEPGITATYDLTFQPEIIADYIGEVNITHNAASGSDQITVTGSGVEPDIELSPTSFAITLQEHETGSDVLTITNTGGYELTFSATVDDGLDAVRSDAGDDIVTWLTIDGFSTTSGTVAANDFIDILVGFDPGGLADGLYTAYIMISSDDPDEPSLSVPVDMTVSTAGISVLPLTFDFGYVIVGETSTLQFTIENTGNSTLAGSIGDLSGFSVVEASTDGSITRKHKLIMENPADILSFSIPGSSSQTYDLIFAPAAVNDYSGIITITHNAADPTVDLQITAHGDEPDIDVNPTSIDVTLETEQTISENLTVANTANVNLNYNALVEYTTTVPINVDVYSQASAKWTGTCTSLDFTDDSEVRGYDTEDGWMMFDTSSIPAGAVIEAVEFHGYVNSTYYPYWSITPVVVDPLTADPATLNADIVAEATSGYYLYRNESSSFSTGWKSYNLAGNVVSDLQSALSQGWFALGIVSRDNSTNYHINYDGWDEVNPPYLSVSCLVSDGSWLTLNGAGSAGGSIAGIGTDQILVGFDSTDLPDDVYEANIKITSNDPDEPEVIVPVTMTVATPGIAVSHSSIDFGNVHVNYSSTQQFSIENTGTAALSGNITTPAGYSVAVSSDEHAGKRIVLDSVPTENRDVLSYGISGGQTVVFDLTFTPSAIGIYSGDVTISHNAGGADETIAVTGTGITVQLGISPTGFDETAYVGGTATNSLTISNTGSANLNYSANIAYDTDALTTVSVYPQSIDRWTGSTDGTTITQTSLVDCTYPQDGWMMFDLTSIPSDAVVQSVNFHGYVNDTYIPYWSITPLTSDPLTADASTLHADIIAEANTGYYLYQNEGSAFAPGWKQYLLGGTIVSDVQAAITSDQFALGIVGRDVSATYYISFDGWNEMNTPYLEIEFVHSSDLWMNLDGDQTMNGNIVAGESQIIDLQMDATNLSAGNYTANINGTSNDPDNSTFSIPVTFTVMQPVGAPENVEIQVSGSTVTVSWDAVSGAMMYKVYSCSTPDGTFTEESGGSFNYGSRVSWDKTYSPLPEKLFFQVTADDIVTDLQKGAAK